MSRFEGNKPNVGAIIVGAIIFALVAGGIFFALRGAPDETQNNATNSLNAENSAVGETASNATGATENSLEDSSSASGNAPTTILTPLPTATTSPQSDAP